MTTANKIHSIVTHDGKFHSDEVTACAIIQILFPNAKVIRTRNREVTENFEPGKIVVDVGNGAYDHHGRNKPKRPNGEFYSSAGLVWQDFGPLLIEHKANKVCLKLTAEELAKIWEKIDKELMVFIDRQDNGIFLDSKEVGWCTVMHLISAMNGEKEDESLNFEISTFIMRAYIENLVQNQLSILTSKTDFLELVEDQGNPQILVMSKGFHWKPHIKQEHKAVYVVHHNNEGGWLVLTVDGSEVDEKNRRLPKKKLPQAWGGLTTEDLRITTGIADATFCHTGLFICGAETRDGALMLAHLALKA